jgi:hypothetical protein
MDATTCKSFSPTARERNKMNLLWLTLDTKQLLLLDFFLPPWFDLDRHGRDGHDFWPGQSCSSTVRRPQYVLVEFEQSSSTEQKRDLLQSLFQTHLTGNRLGSLCDITVNWLCQKMTVTLNLQIHRLSCSPVETCYAASTTTRWSSRLDRLPS